MSVFSACPHPFYLPSVCHISRRGACPHCGRDCFYFQTEIYEGGPVSITSAHSQHLVLGAEQVFSGARWRSSNAIALLWVKTVLSLTCSTLVGLGYSAVCWKTLASTVQWCSTNSVEVPLPLFISETLGKFLNLYVPHLVLGIIIETTSQESCED